MVGQLAFEGVRPVCVLFVAAVPLVLRDKVVGVIFIVIDLGRFEADLIHAYFAGKATNVFQLVFVGFYDEELEKDKGFFTLQLFFSFDDVAGAFQHFFQLTPYPVLFIYFLGGAVDGDDKAIQTTFHRAPCIPVVEIMGIRGGCSIDPFFGCISHHVQEGGIQIRFALKIKDQVQQFF